jgi:uncharacterized protein YyaL (SSP411 family)
MYSAYDSSFSLSLRCNYCNLQVIHIDPTDNEEMEIWEDNNSNIALMARNNFAADKVVALVCQNFTCSPPVTDPKSLKALLLKKPS